MTEVTTHVLDTVTGRPASGIPVELQARTSDGSWWRADGASTDDDGRAGPFSAGAGVHRLAFDLADRDGIYPEVTVTFEIGEDADHLHLPLLLGPYGYTTYRGS